MTKVCVTGALGYIGTAVVPALLEAGHEVSILDTVLFGNSLKGLEGKITFTVGDIRDHNARMMALEGCDSVIHLAGIVTDALVDLNPTMGAQVNQQATRDLCEDAITAGVSRFIYASSSSVYGSHDEPCTEETITVPETRYAMSKLVGEGMVRQFKKELTVVCVRCATACGPSSRMRADTIINTFSGQAWFNQEITVWDGTQWRSNIHVLDVAGCYTTLVSAPESIIRGKVYNITHSNHTALDLGQMVRDEYIKLTGNHCTLTVDTTKKDTRQYKMDASLIHQELGWAPKYTIKDAVLHNFDFFQKGFIKDFEDPLYWNTKRMGDIVRSGNYEIGRL